MRQVLVFAVLLLGLALAVDRELASSEVAARAQEGELDWVQVYSTAQGHEPAAPLIGQALSSIHFRRYRLEQRTLNSRGLSNPGSLPGLVVAAIGLDGELVGTDWFKPGVVTGETARLAAWSAGLRRGTLLLVTRRGSMSPRGQTAAEEIAQLEALLTGWGSLARPWESDTMSWAHAARRTSTGWEPVVEAASATRGVMLTVPISPDDRSGPATKVASSRQGLTLLGRAAEGHRVALGVSLKDLSVDSYVLPQGVTSELTWTDLEFHDRPRFTALVGANEGSRFMSQGVVFHLLLGGVTLDSVETRTPANERPSWLHWEVELPESAAPQELKLIAEPLPGSKAAAPQVGAPLLSFGT